jgi:radical SAM protein with 4Fe4S-binding SPASM domain
MNSEIKFFDPNINRKKDIVSKSLKFFPNTNFPLPSEVEISESGTCNRKCSFCPRSDPNFEDIKVFISSELHNKLCKELKVVNYSGTFRYSGFVEPLLDKNIFNLIAEVRSYLPDCNIEMVTNGDVLNKKRLIKLFDSGLDVLLISVYDGPEDVLKFEEMIEDANINKTKVVIRHRYLPPEKDFGITMSNRAGAMQNAEHVIKPLNNKMDKPCYIPSYTFFMDYNGDVLMCPHDWLKKRVLGNLNKNTFSEIWLSKMSIFNRKKLNMKNRSIAPCNVCDVQGDLIGKEHSKYW